AVTPGSRDDPGQTRRRGRAREPRRERLTRRQMLGPVVGAEQPAERREPLPPKPRRRDRVDLDQAVGAPDQEVVNRRGRLQVEDPRPPRPGTHGVARKRMKPPELAPRAREPPRRRE